MIYLQKLLRTVQLACALFAIFVAPGMAQTLECSSCEGVPWGPTQEFTTEIESDINACILKINYRTRICNGVPELQIISIRPNTPFFCDEFYETPGHQPEFVNRALADLLILNPMSFPPFVPNATPISWRILQPACWKIDSPRRTISCGVDCCELIVTVVMNGCGVLEFPQVTQPSQPPDCRPTGLPGETPCGDLVCNAGALTELISGP